MKAYIVRKPGPIESIESIDIEIPQPGKGEVQIAVLGSSVNPADVNVSTGGKSSGFIHSKKSPVRLGYDFSGKISKVGDGVTSWQISDEVYGHLPYSSKTTQGSYSEYVVVTTDSIALKPQKLGHNEAGTVPTSGNTALQSLVELGKIRPGMKVLINGASGGVGSYAVQLAKHFEAEVWGSASQGNQQYIKNLGVDHPIDYKKTSVLDLEQKFDIFFDVTSNLTFNKCKSILKSGGVYITLLPTFSFLTGILSSIFSSKKCKMCFVKSKTESLEQLSKLINEHKVKANISTEFELSKIQEALSLSINSSNQGKIAIKY